MPEVELSAGTIDHLDSGAHRHPVHDDADLSLPGIARLLAEFIDRLDLHDGTLVGNDSGGALVKLLMCDPPMQVARVVLASCDAFAVRRPRHGADAARGGRRHRSADPHRRDPARLRAPRTRRLGQ